MSVEVWGEEFSLTNFSTPAFLCVISIFYLFGTSLLSLHRLVQLKAVAGA